MVEVLLFISGYFQVGFWGIKYMEPLPDLWSFCCGTKTLETREDTYV